MLASLATPDAFKASLTGTRPAPWSVGTLKNSSGRLGAFGSTPGNQRLVVRVPSVTPRALAAPRAAVVLALAEVWR